MTTHTPGPWVWVEGTGTINRRWNSLDWTVASVGNHRLGWNKDKNREAAEAGANARLIAAAPELLNALQWFIENDDTNIGQPGNEFREEGLNLGISAIAKATGAAV